MFLNMKLHLAAGKLSLVLRLETGGNSEPGSVQN